MTDQLNNQEESHYLQLKHPDLPECKHIDVDENGICYDCQSFVNDDITPLMEGEMYKPESREFELERENERLKIVVDTLKEENKRLRDSLFGHHHSLPNDKNNY